MIWILVIATVVGLAMAWLLAARGEGRKGRGIAALYAELNALTHDRAVTERLVEAERSRNPDLSEGAIVRRVIRRLRYERRR